MCFCYLHQSRHRKIVIDRYVFNNNIKRFLCLILSLSVESLAREKGRKSRHCIISMVIYTHYTLSQTNVTTNKPARFSIQSNCYLYRFLISYLGRLYDKNGNFNDWWSEESEANFTSKSDCLVDQYGDYKVFGKNVSGSIIFFLLWKALETNRSLTMQKGELATRHEIYCLTTYNCIINT